MPCSFAVLIRIARAVDRLISLEVVFPFHVCAGGFREVSATECCGVMKWKELDCYEEEQVFMPLTEQTLNSPCTPNHVND